MITEPATMITDYILAVVSLWCGRKTAGIKLPPGRTWSRSFVVLSLASLTGGTTHGFVLLLPPLVYDILWYITLIAVSLADLFLLWGGIEWSLGNGLRTQLLKLLAILKFLVVIPLVLLNPVFGIAAIDYGISFITLVLLRSLVNRSGDEYRDLLIAFGWGLLTGIIWFGRIGITSWFTHTDVAHLTQLGVILFLYRVVDGTRGS